MKKIVFPILMLLAFINQTTAQSYNETFYEGQCRSYDVIDASFGGMAASCHLGNSATYPIILRKLDFNGNVLFNQVMNINTPGAILHPTKVIHTPNDEYIVVGIIVTSTYNPFAARFSSNGIVQWFKEYNSNPGTPGSGDEHKVNICRVEDDGPAESYIITASGQDPYSTGPAPGSGDDFFVNALRIDGNGNLLWNKKYLLLPTPPYNTYTYDVRVSPESLVFINDSNPRYFIGGGLDGNLLGDGFFMSINKLGHIVNRYTTLHTSLHWFEEAIYDNTTREVITGYTTGNVTSGIMSSPTAAGVTKYSTAGGGLTYSRSDFFALASSANETYGYGIKDDPAHSSYVLAAFVVPPVSNTPCSMALMRVGKTAPGVLNIFSDYNINRISYTTGVIKLVDGLNENYVLDGSIPVPGSSTYAMRVISTDNAGIACGRNPLDYNHSNPSFTTISDSLIEYNESGVIQHNVTTNPVAPKYDNCDDYVNAGGSAASYRRGETSVSNVTTTEDIAIYPTLLKSESEVHIDLNAGNNTSLDVIITSIDGRLISKSSLSLKEGANKLTVNMPAIAPGNYILKATTLDGSINKSIKLTRL